jgi:hypothetical protein
MYGETKQEDLRFKVECSWCGEIIRRNNVKNGHGMCLKCYARMIGEHDHSHEFSDTPRWARGDGGER